MNQSEIKAFLEFLENTEPPKGYRSGRWALPRGYQNDFRPFIDEADKVRCAARTRQGTPCQAQGLGRGFRCKNHGGMSTGPRTIEGKEQISRATLARWRVWKGEE